MRQANRDAPLGFRGIECRQHLELLNFVARTVLKPVDFGELLTRRNERGRSADSLIEGCARIRELLSIFQTQSEHVVRFVESRVELDGLLQRGNRARQAPGAT